MLLSFYLSILITTVVATTSPAHHDIPSQRFPLALAPFYTLQAEHQDQAVNNSYIVVLKDDLSTFATDNHFNLLQAINEEDPLIVDVPTGISQVYNSYLKGYAGRFTDAVVQRIREMPEVSFIEQDSIVRAFETQHSATWVRPSAIVVRLTTDSDLQGLARFSHRKKLGPDTYALYEHDPTGGEGVDVYIIDTGINIHHAEFEGRASWGKTSPKHDVDEDANGHGTHCAGTVGSRKYGVAKAANLIAVKVLGSNGSGSTSDVIAGVL